jgi:hypothetical protein
MGHDFDHYLLDCLRRLPRGGDALEGIARWWMLRQRVCETLSAAGCAGAARGLLGRESCCR